MYAPDAVGGVAVEAPTPEEGQRLPKTWEELQYPVSAGTTTVKNIILCNMTATKDNIYACNLAYCQITLHVKYFAVYFLQEISIMRFAPTRQEDKGSYSELFTYLNSRNRCGVVGANGKFIKDLYIMAVSARNKIPSVLFPINGPGTFKKISKN